MKTRHWAALRRAGAGLAVLAAGALLGACGGGGGGSPTAATPELTVASAGTPASLPVLPSTPIPAAAPNVLRMQLDRGPAGRAFNSPFVRVTLCRPGTAECTTLDHVLVDTGSVGLRVMASALPPAWLEGLPPVADAAGAPVGECMQFASGHAWGSVRRLDLRLADEVARGLAVHVLGDRSGPYADAPGSCTRVGPDITGLVDAQAILGVGLGRLDCGVACALGPQPQIYFACAPGGCTATRLDPASQVAHPVAALGRHNNGVVLVLPQVPAAGTPVTAGALVLGIGTGANNQLGAARVLDVNARGLFTTTYKGRRLPSFMDSGSNALYFPDDELTPCSGVGFYCPPLTAGLRATLSSPRGVVRDVDFWADAMWWLRGDAVAAHLAGTTGHSPSGMFNWGLPFFFGRAVHVAVEGGQTPAGPGPFLAF